METVGTSDQDTGYSVTSVLYYSTDCAVIIHLILLVNLLYNSQTNLTLLNISPGIPPPPARRGLK